MKVAIRSSTATVTQHQKESNLP
nr:unnamed protein product [Callosobruchus analis]